MNDAAKELVLGLMESFKKGELDLPLFHSSLEGAFNMIVVEDTRKHEALTRKFTNELELIQFTMPQSQWFNAAVAVAERVEEYISTI
jgi:hypothetical protein